MKRLHRFFILLACVSGATAQTTVTLQCSMDAAIGFHDGANTAGNNYGAAIQNAAFWIPSVASSTGSNGNRALFNFPLSSLPSNARIAQASLNLYAIPVGVLGGHLGPNNASLLRRVTQPWHEFSVTWNNQPSSTSVGQVSLAPSASFLQDYTNINVTGLVRDMLNNPQSSHGFLLKLINEANSGALLFGSRDHWDPSKRPTLVITYDTCQSVAVAQSTTSLCSGASTTFSASPFSGSFVWYSSPAGGTVLATGPVFTTPALYTGSNPQVRTFFVGEGGCAGRTPVSVTVNPTPVISIHGPLAPICSGQSATLTAFGAQNFIWMNGTLGPVTVVSPSITGTYVVSGVSSRGCIGTRSFSLSVVPQPDVTVAASATLICAGQSVSLAANGASLFQWVGGGINIANPAVVVTPSAATVYTAYGTNGAGCIASAAVFVQVSACTGVSEGSEISAVRFYPNPANDIIQVTDPAGVREIEILDAAGRSVRRIDGGREVIECSDLPAGLYLFRIRYFGGGFSHDRLILN